MNKNTPHSTVFVMVGIPGSGKSTYSKIHYKNIKYVSRDEIRFSVLKLNEDYFSHEKQVYNIFIKEIVSAIENQQDVCVDATHTTIASRAKLMNAIERNTKNKDFNYVYVVMNIPIERVLSQNNKRSGIAKVPEDAIWNMYNTMTVPAAYENNRIKEIIIYNGE